MHCKESQAKFDDYLDGQLSTAARAAVDGHLRHCVVCRRVFEQSQNLYAALRTMPSVSPRAGYVQRVLGFLHTADGKPSLRTYRPLWFATGFASVIFAVFAVWFMLAMPVRPSVESVAGITLHIVPHQVRKVDLVFNSPNHIRQATLRIELPPGIELDGYRQRRILQWQTELKQGRNRLALPLIADGRVGGVLTASISHQGRTRSFKVNIVTDGGSSQGIPLNQSV